MPTLTLLMAALVLAVLDWIAVWNDWRRLEYVLKPAVMVALIAWFVQVTGLQGQAPWFLAGLVLSLAGDIFLMLPQNLFVGGLAAFLLAHLTYASGFNPDLPPVTILSGLIVVVIGVAAMLLYRRVVAGETLQKSTPGLRGGTLAYTLAITLMTMSAVITLVRPEWDRTAAIFAAVGALSFFTSDALLALDRFDAPIRHGRIYVMITYHLGQLMLIYGVALQINGG